MPKNQPPAIDHATLRRQAEAQLRDQLHRPSPSSDEATLRLVHELQVHQIELELQNHALLEIRNQLEQRLEKYTDLYDFSPVGHFTLARDGTIQEVNLAGATLLAMDRTHLIGVRFGLLVADQSRPGFNAFLDQLLTGATQECCEVVITHENAPPRDLGLQGVGLEGETGWQYRVSALDITDHKRTEAQLLDSVRQIRSLFTNVPIGMFQSTPSGHFTFVNPALATMLGFASPDEAVEVINRSSIAEAVYEDPSRRPQLVGEVQQAQGSWKVYENRYRRRDGSGFDGILTFSEHPDPISGEHFLYGFVQDITERKQMETALRLSEEQYRAVIETSPDGFWIVDRQGRLLEANEAYARLSGYSRAELRAMTIADLEVSESPEKTAAHIEKIIRDGNNLFQTLHRAKSGRVR